MRAPTQIQGHWFTMAARLCVSRGVVFTAQGISVQHLDRLLGGELLAVARAILTHLGLLADASWARGRDPTLVYDDLESPWEGPADCAERAGGG